MIIQGVLFDLDGLLVDTEKPFLNCWVEVCNACGYTVSMAEALKMVGMGLREEETLLKDMYGDKFPFEELRDKTLRLTEEMHNKNGVLLMPGAKELLSHVKNKGLPSAVATGTFYERAVWKLRSAGILNVFDAICTGSDVEKGKPAPDIFILAAEKIGIAPENCVGFEDSPVGLLSLNAAGVKSVFVKDQIEPPPSVLKTVWKRFNRLDEAITLF
ncbi:MAG: HAD family phosphatase [Spirochaetaceae bacterium]|jgi:HAD superfamily hydrolase (TIGR01509 family)|nr:HAD family phosphatase [Spirochaetaceae bacterium]